MKKQLIKITTDVNGKPLGMAWYNYLVRFGLGAGAVFSFLYSFAYLSGSIYMSETNGQVTAAMVYSYYGIVLQIVDILYGLSMIGTALFALFVRERLANYESGTLKAIYIYFSTLAGVPFIYVVIVALITSQINVINTISILITGLLYSIFNVKYFKKRAHLFVDKTAHLQTPQYPTQQTPVEATPVYAPISTDNIENAPQEEIIEEKTTRINPTVKYCSRCGKPIDPISKKCTGCGKQYFKGISLKLFLFGALIFCLVLALVMVLSIATYGGDNDNTVAGGNTDSTNNTTGTVNNSTENTQGTTAPNTPPATHTHSYAHAVIAPTCTADGYTTHKCSCGDTYIDNRISAHGHSWGGWTTEVAAEVGIIGLEKRTCSACKTTETRLIPALQEDTTKIWFVNEYNKAKQQHINSLNNSISSKNSDIANLREQASSCYGTYLNETIRIKNQCADMGLSNSGYEASLLKNAENNYKSQASVYTNKIQQLENEIITVEAEITNPSVDSILEIVAKNNNISSIETYEYYYKYSTSIY